MKLPNFTRVTRIEGIEEPAGLGRFSEITIADGKNAVTLRCDPDSDELRIVGGSKKRQRGSVSLLSGRFRVEWLWSMENQQGYSDGIRIQLRSKSESRVFEFISAASSVEVFEAKRLRSFRVEGR